MEKEALRTLMREKRRTLSVDEINGKSCIIEKKLFNIDEFLRSKTVMVYLSSFNEVSTDGIINRLFKDKKRIAVPISNTISQTLTLSYLESTEEFVKGAYGIREPSVIRECKPEDIDVILVPGIAFDIHGNRIGFGKGYYDKLLSCSGSVKIGLCYDFQLIPSIESDKHDIPMDIIITEERIIRNAF